MCKRKRKKKKVENDIERSDYVPGTQASIHGGEIGEEDGG